MKPDRLPLWFRLASIILLLVSLTQECYSTTGSSGDSIAVFLVGIFGVAGGGAAITWLANPALICSWIFLRKKQVLSLVFSLIAFGLAVSFLFFETVLDDEGGHYKKIIAYHAGYWLWVGSCAVMLTGNVIGMWKNKISLVLKK